MKQQVEVEVLGQRLTLLSDDGGDHVLEVAGHVDREARRLAASHPRASVLQLALLTALNIGSEWRKLSGDCAQMEEAIARLSRRLGDNLA